MFAAISFDWILILMALKMTVQEVDDLTGDFIELKKKSFIYLHMKANIDRRK